jgi:hypothetical protein
MSCEIISNEEEVEVDSTITDLAVFFAKTQGINYKILKI